MSDDAPESMWTSFHAALVGGERWEEFDAIYSPVIRGWAGRFGLQGDAGDLAQEVYLKLTKALAAYDKDRGEFRGWLYRVVQNAALSHVRRLGRHPGARGTGDSAVKELLEQQAADDLASDLSALADGRARLLGDIRSRCAGRDWEIMCAFQVHQSAARVAADFDTTAPAVHQAIYRVRQAARALRTPP